MTKQTSTLEAQIQASNTAKATEPELTPEEEAFYDAENRDLALKKAKRSAAAKKGAATRKANAEAAKAAAEAAKLATELEKLEGGQSNLAKTIRGYRDQYVPSIGPGGTKSVSNGDAVAHALKGLQPDSVLALAEELLELETGFLVQKYAHLNRGQRRMNGGNRIRAALKRGALVIDDKGEIRKLSS